jgi:MFS family permease
MILGGILGAAVIPLLSDTVKRRKPVLLAAVAPAVLITYPLCTVGSYPALLALAFALGFFLLPAFALLLAISGEIAGVERAGAATSVVMLAGNAGGVVVTLLVPAAKGSGTSYRPAAVMMVALLALTVGLTTQVPETFPGRKPPGTAPVL